MAKGQGIPRAPFTPDYSLMPELGPRNGQSRATTVSYATAALLSAYSIGAAERLGFDTDDPFMFDEHVHELWLQLMEERRASSFVRNRDANDVGSYLGVRGRVLEQEYVGKSILDIGCGEGLVLKDAQRLRRASVTYLDMDDEVLDTIPDEWGRKVAGTGQRLDFDDEEFDVTQSVFSAITWPETPVDVVQAFNEQMRVLAVGGTGIIVTAFQSTDRKAAAHRARIMHPSRSSETEKRLARAEDLKNVGLLNAMSELAQTGLISITWHDTFDDMDGENIDMKSAVIDKNASIPPELLAANIDYISRYCSVGPVDEHLAA